MRTPIAAAAALLLLAVPAHAQLKTEISPHLGMYLPLAPVLKASDVNETGLDSKRQVGAGVLGARFVVRWSEHLGVETSLALSPSMVAITDLTSTVDVSGRIGFASARFVFRMADRPDPGRWAFHGGPGLGVVWRRGTAWEDAEGTTDLALVLGAGGSFRPPRMPFTFRVEIENYLSWVEFRGGDLPRHRPRVNHDFIYSLGLTFPIGSAEP